MDPPAVVVAIQCPKCNTLLGSCLSAPATDVVMDAVDNVKVSQGRVRCAECETVLGGFSGGVYTLHSVRRSRLPLPPGAARKRSSAAEDGDEDDYEENSEDENQGDGKEDKGGDDKKTCSRAEMRRVRRRLEKEITDLKEMVVAIIDRM